MTQEEKQLLLKDLCARLPYGVRVKMEAQAGPYSRVEFTLLPEKNRGFERLLIWLETGDRYLVQPYLRPMSSMTEEECKELGELPVIIENVCETLPNVPYYIEVAKPEQLDWLNSHHFDYRGLIEKSLAIVAPEEMYK